MKTKSVQKRKVDDIGLFHIAKEKDVDLCGTSVKKKCYSYDVDNENFPENVMERFSGLKHLVPHKLIKCTFNELNSKRFLESYEKGTTNNEVCNNGNGALSSNDDVEYNDQNYYLPASSQALTTVTEKEKLTDMLFNSNSYMSNPFERKSNFQSMSCNPFVCQASDASESENEMNKNKSLLVNANPKMLKPFTPQNFVNLEEKVQYKMIVDQFTDDMFYPNTMPAMKNFEDCKDKLSNWKFERKVKQVLTVKPTSNISDITFYNDDETFVLDVVPYICDHSKELEKFSASGGFQSKKEMMERMRTYMGKKMQIIKKFQERRSKKWRNELQNLPELPLSLATIEAFNLKKKLVLPELTAEMNAVIDNALMFRNQNAIVSKNSNYNILYKDIETLVGLNWLNDEIINTYLDLIKSRSKHPDYPSVHVFSSFFYPKLKSSGYSAVKRWTRKDDIFSYDINLVPLHLGMHWCLAVIDHRYKKIQYYDSLNSKENCTHILHEYLVQEHMDKKKKPFDKNGWILESMENIPQQNNGSDCGMFTLKYAEYVTRNAEINFTQDHMPYFRKKMVYEIVTGQLV